MEDLTLKDVFFILAFPYVLIGYLLLCLVYAPVEYVRSRIGRNTSIPT